MGCGEVSKIKKSQSVPLLISRRVSKELRRGETFSTNRNSVTFSSKNSLKLTESTCLKFRIFEDFQDLIAQESSLASSTDKSVKEYASDIRYIKKHWILFKSAFSYLLLLTHGSCIDQFKANDAAVILLVSCLACQKSFESDILIHHEAPYIVFLSISGVTKETSEIIKAWQGFGSALGRFTPNRLERLEISLQRFGALMGMYQTYKFSAEEEKQARKSVKSLKNLTAACKDLIQSVKDSQNQLNEFIQNFKYKKSELQSLGALAHKGGHYSGEQIVHDVLSN